MELQGSISTTFTNVLHVLSLSTNLLSVSALLSKECKVYFKEGACFIYCPNGIHLRTGIQKENLFCLSMTNHALVITRSPL